VTTAIVKQSTLRTGAVLLIAAFAGYLMANGEEISTAEKVNALVSIAALLAPR
jgi:hypothetical protein